MIRKFWPLAMAALMVSAAVHAQGPQAGSDADKYIWLEDVSSARSMAWVNAENAKTAKVLEADPHYAPFEAEALKLAQAPDRLTMPDQRGDLIYNFWRDAEHVNGIRAQDDAGRLSDAEAQLENGHRLRRPG